MSVGGLVGKPVVLSGLATDSRFTGPIACSCQRIAVPLLLHEEKVCCNNWLLAAQVDAQKASAICPQLQQNGTRRTSITDAPHGMKKELPNSAPWCAIFSMGAAGGGPHLPPVLPATAC